MTKEFKQKYKLLGLLLILCVTGCEAQREASISPYPVMDSGMTASTDYADKIYWMDNDRVIFVSYGPKPKTVEENKKRKPAIYIWDTRNNKVEKYANGSHLCYHNGYIRYAFYGDDAPERDPKLPSWTFWKEGPFGDEKTEIAAFSTKEEYRNWYHANPVNPYTCRMVKKPEAMKGKVWLPLLAQGGALEWETDTLPGAPETEQPIVYRRAFDNQAGRVERIR